MKKTFVLIVFIALYTSGYTQKLNVNLFLATSNYEGDMQANFFTFQQPGLALGAAISYQLTDRFHLRAGYTSATLMADDKKNPKVFFRNLNFKTSLHEIHLAGEYYLFTDENSRISPYAFGGIAVYRFNPYTTDTLGNKYFLQPLSTEGQGFVDGREPYKLTQFAIPFGGGIKYALTDNIKIGAELGMRKLFTDYLDDVSTTYVAPDVLLANRGPKAVELAYRGAEIDKGQTYPTVLTKRGESRNKDWYYFTGITLSYRLPSAGDLNNGLGSSTKRKKYILACPR